MTSDMAFECLLVSRDESLFRTINGILRELSISTSACVTPSRVPDALGRESTDLVVVDCELEGARDLLDQIWKVPKKRKPTVLAISSKDLPPGAAHLVIRTPVTPESARKALRAAYYRMMLDYRRTARYTLMMPVIATFNDGRTASVTITDIGDGGVGILCRDPLSMEDTFSFRVWLPGTVRQILLSVKVLWTREHGRGGCEFLRIPPVDLMILHDWLKAKVQIKKPRIELD
jgi:PilZ domain